MRLNFKYGFEYKGVNYGWNNKKLYRFPYIKNNRSYVFKEIPFYCFKSTLVYNVQRTKLTINKLKFMTVEINFNIDVISENECPF